MKKSNFKLKKKLLAIVFVLVLCVENFAAVVSDNDGSAFITKAEFDSLKNNFQSQIDKFNTSIDAKIDEAISSYLAGITTKRTFEPDILFNKLSASRRNFRNNFSNPTTNTQADVRLEICKQLTLATVGLWQTMGQSIERANSSFYAISTLSGNHAKSRQPKNNGKNGRFLLVKPSSYGGYTVSDGYTYSIEQKVDISGGEIKEESYLDKPIFNYYQNTSHNFTSYSTDTIFTQNLNIAKVQTEAGGSVTNITVPAMVSICVLEAKYTKYDQFFNMSSGNVWTANTGCVPYNNLHTWTYTNSDIKLASGEAQAYGGWFKWNSSSTASDKRVWTGRNVYTDYTTTRTWVPVSFKGPKIEMISGANLVVEDVSNLVDTKTYYYSGLPLFTLSETGKMTMDLGFAWSTKAETIVAIRDLPFDNTNITSKSSKDIFWKKYSTSDIPSSNRVTITIDAKDLKDRKGKTLYIKMKSNNTATGAWVRGYINSCKIEVE
jgi:hypothetical protein